ncbi:MAG: T9SS type A sorting domain-containing protein [Flavobacteriales bacterium]|nr:T9SS type A sorting domain-containing protein [Flavobacteriales bacterium]
MLSLTILTNAQIVINQVDFYYGEVNFHHLSDTSNGTTGISPGNSGTNQTWDFSAFTSGNLQDLHSDGYTSISSDPLFPTANLKATVISNMPGYSATRNFYYNINQNGFDYLGLTSQASYSGTTFDEIVYEIPYARLLPFPTQYSTTSVNNFIQEQYGLQTPTSPSGVDSTHNRYYRTNDFECDGWGTLITPFGSFNALRVKKTTSNIDTSWAKINGVWVMSSTNGTGLPQTSYHWYAENGFELASLQLYSTSNPNSWKYTFKSEFPLTVTEKSVTSIEVYPNPTHSILNINSEENSKILILNLLGETVAEEYLKVGNNSIDVSRLKNGIYFIQTEKGNVSKFVKN